MGGFIGFTDRKRFTIREAAILTNTFVPGQILGSVSDKDKLVLDVEFTIGSLTSGDIKLEFSEDGGNTWFQQTAVATTGGSMAVSLAEFTLTADGNYRIETDLLATSVRISAKGTGTVTGSSMKIEASVILR